MKLIVLQTTVRALYLTKVTTGRNPIFDAPKCFELPKELQNGKIYYAIPSFAKFVRSCMNSLNKNEGNRIVFCLEDDNVISKEYQHLPCKTKELLKLASLEAETVLHGNINDYTIENYEYNYPNPVTGKLKSSLFAVNSKLILDLKTEFNKCGLYIIKIVPPISGLLYAAKNFLDTKNQIIGVLDVSYEKTRIVLLENGFPIFQRTFEPVFDEIIEILMAEHSLSYRDAVKLIFEHGFFGNDSCTPKTSAEHQIVSLIDAALSEAVRNIRMVLSSERLEPDKLIVCGILESIPNFEEFLENLELDFPFDTIESCTNHFPNISKDAKTSKFYPSRFFTLFGLLSVKESEEIDFLNSIKSKSHIKTSNFVVLALVTIFTICFMTLLPNRYKSMLKQQEEDKAELRNPKYSEIISLLDKNNKLDNELLKIENNKELLTTHKSTTNTAIDELLSEVVSKVKSVENCEYDSKSGKITIAFLTSDYNDYLTLKKSIEANDCFDISVPFRAEKSENNGYICNVTLTIKGFKPSKESGDEE